MGQKKIWLGTFWYFGILLLIRDGGNQRFNCINYLIQILSETNSEVNHLSVEMINNILIVVC